MRRKPGGFTASFVWFMFVGLRLCAVDLYDPVAVYLTWQREPQTTMTVQWITNPDRASDLIEYQKAGETDWKSVTGKHAPMPEKYAFLIHQAEIKGLQPDTDYRFRTGSDAVSFKFRTMPEKFTKPVRFVVGGDIYHDGIGLVEKMNRQIAKLEPMFVLAGGDLAYNEGGRSTNPKVMPRWLDLLIAWKKQLVAADGRLIPVIPVIGNHDVKGALGNQPANAQFFYSLFAMPGSQGYNVLDFGDYLSIFLLDSGHTHPIPGEQTQWLKTALEKRRQVSQKFAIYHVACYPSVRSYNGGMNSKIRKHWVPLFEQFGINAAFEHHDHAYKRTHPLIQGKPHPKGVLYIGDGAWGVERPRTPKNLKKAPYLAKTLSSRNIILVHIHDNTRHFYAYDDNGNIIDDFTSIGSR